MKRGGDVGEIRESGRSQGSHLAVCDECVGDPYLAELVRAHGGRGPCDYCERSEMDAIAAPSEEVFDVIRQAVGLGPVALSRSGRCSVGDLVAPTAIDVAIDAVLEGLKPTSSRAFWGAVAFLLRPRHASVVVQVKYPLQTPPRLEVEDPWLGFVRHVRQGGSVNFSGPAHGSPGTNTAGVAVLLEEIGRTAERLGLIRALRAGTRVARVRLRLSGAEWVANQDGMGAPPNGRAIAGRISAAGTHYFFGALEVETAIAEMASAPPVQLVAGAFELRREARVLDLCGLKSEGPARERAHPQDVLVRRFLAGLAQAVSPVVRSHGDQVDEYEPSRIVCDWLAHRFELHGEYQASAHLDGLLYPSAVAPGGHNLVLFASADGSAPGMDRIDFLSRYELALKSWDELADALGYEPKVGTVPR